MNPTVLDLYCGAGGFSLGFKMAGYDILMGVDNDPDAITTYVLNVGDGLVGDVRTFKYEGPKPDVIIGSPPCQCFSKANIKTRTQDLSLVDKFFEIVLEIQPKVWIMEEVNGTFFALKKMGRTNFHIVRIDAADYGVPSHRPRFFASNVSPILPFETVKHVPASTVLNDSDLDVHLRVQHWDWNKRLHSINYPAPTVTTKAIQMLHSNAQRNPKNRRNFPLTEPSPVVTSKDPRALKPNGKTRLLTIQETAALMSFPRNFRWPKGKTRSRRQIGNAVPPLLAYKMAETVKIHIS